MTIVLRAVLLLGAYIFIARSCTFAKKGKKNPHLKNLPNRTLESIENPLIEPTLCGNEHNVPSLMCDPDKVLPPEEMEDMDASITDTTIRSGVNCAVVILSKMNISGYTDAPSAAQAFASSLHQTYKLGNLGLLFFLSIDEKQIIFERGLDLLEVRVYRGT